MSIMGRDWLLTEHHVIPELLAVVQSYISCREEGVLQMSVCVCVSGVDIKAGSR